MTFWRNYYHLVWATKKRMPFIEAHLEKPLFGYMIRMIVAIPPKLSVADAVKNLKGARSHYIHRHI